MFIERMDDPGTQSQSEIDAENAETVNRRFHAIFGAVFFHAEDVDAMKPLRLVQAKRLNGSDIKGAFELEE